jgi:mannosyltransferase
MAAVIVLAAALRVFDLGAESVWLDEAYSIQTARGSVTDILGERLTDIHPPLYYLTLHYWMQLAGHSEFATRLPSAIFDLCTIVIAYAVAHRLLGRRVALLTALLLAVSPFHVEFSQEARMYALLCLLSTLSMYAFLAWFDPIAGRSHRWTDVYVVSTGLMLYTHVYGFFIPLAQVLILALSWRRHPDASWALKRWLVSHPLVLLIFSPWLPAFIEQARRVQSAFWIPPPMIIQLFQPLWTYSGSIPLTMVLAPLALVGIVTLARSPSRTASLFPRCVLLAWLGAPIVMPFLLSFLGSPIFLPKYTIAASVPFAMLVAAGALSLRTERWRTLVVVAIAAASVFRFQHYYAAPDKDGWRPAVAELERLARPADVVVFYPWFNQVPFAYYQRRDDLLQQPFVAEPDDPAPAADDVPLLAERATRDRQRAWLVVLQGTGMKSLIVAELSRHMTPVRHWVGHRVELYLFERKR